VVRCGAVWCGIYVAHYQLHHIRDFDQRSARNIFRNQGKNRNYILTDTMSVEDKNLKRLLAVSRDFHRRILLRKFIVTDFFNLFLFYFMSK
jgi:hypothetical protein